MTVSLYGQSKVTTYNYSIKDSSPCYCNLAIQSPVIQNATSCELANGSISVTVSGGTGSYDYTWSDSFGKIVATNRDATNLPVGFYFLAVKDKNNSLCRGQGNFEITSDLQILSTTTSNSNCITPNGAIAISATGGSGVYTYEWTYPDGSKILQKNILGLKAGQYTLKVTDNIKACSISKSITVKNLVNISVAKVGQSDNTSCLSPNGSINVTVSGGSSKYKFYWYDINKGAYIGYNEDLTGVKGGQYSLYVIDETSGCINYQSFEVFDTTLSPTYTLSTSPNTNCAAPFDGKIDLTPGGTSGPFSVTWTNGQSTVSSLEDPSDLAPGKYGFTLSDNSTGCSITVPASVSIDDQSSPAVSIESAELIDNTDCLSPNGKITISASSENRPITYSWTGPNNFTSTSESISGLAAGMYSLTVSVPCGTNQPPQIRQTQIATNADELVSLNLLDIISDPDDNLNPQTIEVVQDPSSGATYSISGDYVLALNYIGKPYKGKDNLRLRACDLLNACSEQSVTIDVSQSGKIIVYNAVAPYSSGDNKYMRITNLPDFDNHVTIFNRWGDMVFEVINYNNNVPEKRFEGLGSNGQLLPSGTYFYKIKIKGEETMSGYLALKN